MAGKVTKLEVGETLTPAGVFQGPWHSFRRDWLTPGAAETFDAAEVEHAIFVQAGSGTAVIGSQTTDVSPGSSIVVGYGARAVITAGPIGLEFFDTMLSPFPSATEA